MNRTFRRIGPAADPTSKLARGRPLGYLVAWLRAGLVHFGPGPDHPQAHFDARLGGGLCEFLKSGESEERQSARAWVMTHMPRNLEAPKRDGEADEPEGMP